MGIPGKIGGPAVNLTFGDIKVWNESLIGLIKELENLLNFKEKAKDPGLSGIFSEQLITHRQNYVTLHSLLDGTSRVDREPTIRRYPSLSVSDAPSSPHLVLEGNAGASSDRLLAYSHFLACCRGGREFAWNLFDVSYPPLAEVLEQAILQYAEDAVTMKQWLLDHGHYLIEWAASDQIQALQAAFR